MMWSLLLCVSFLVYGRLCVASQNSTFASVFFNSTTNTYYLVSGIDQNNGVAYGNFDDGLLQTGWGVFKVKTNNKFDDLQQWYAAGFLEGALTAQRIHDMATNTYALFFSSTPPSAKLMEFLEVQDSWARSHIQKPFQQLSDYWKQVALVIAQFDGLYAGYQAYGEQPLDYFNFQLLNGVGDFLDLIPALHVEKRIDYLNLSAKEAARKLGRNGHCSGLVKVKADMSDIFVGHSSWFEFSETNRIFKHYYFDSTSDFIAAKKISFSSYPGFLESLDDFYMMDSGLAMIQTTNGIINTKLYEKVHPENLFAWQRVRLASHMAHSGKEWSELMAKHNSGTYNNQYMVVDFKKFSPGNGVEKGTLWVSEQIPGLVEYADVTSQLERGYWPSYNVPYFEKIYNESGYPSLTAKFGADFSYQMAPRAQIFRRDAGAVEDLDSFKHILRYNNYKTDPISKGDPGRAICSRFDLEQQGADAGGCYDTKVTNLELYTKFVAHAINGPTTQNGLPPFSWNNFPQVSHVGLPSVYNFDFVVMDPQWD